MYGNCFSAFPFLSIPISFIRSPIPMPAKHSSLFPLCSHIHRISKRHSYFLPFPSQTILYSTLTTTWNNNGKSYNTVLHMSQHCCFYRATRMHSAAYAVARCLSACLSSVRPSHAGIVCKRSHILKVFSPLGSPTILVFPHQTEWPETSPLKGAPNARGYEKSRFATNIGLYLGTDAR